MPSCETIIRITNPRNARITKAMDQEPISPTATHSNISDRNEDIFILRDDPETPVESTHSTNERHLSFPFTQSETLPQSHIACVFDGSATSLSALRFTFESLLKPNSKLTLFVSVSNYTCIQYSDGSLLDFQPPHTKRPSEYPIKIEN